MVLDKVKTDGLRPTLEAVFNKLGQPLPLGYCNVGNFGSDQRLTYTIIGGEVNIAQRLEGNSDPNGILISYETYINCLNNVNVKLILHPEMGHDWPSTQSYNINASTASDVVVCMVLSRVPSRTLPHTTRMRVQLWPIAAL